MCMIRTVNGRQIMLKHNVSNPTPYDRGSRYTGSKGVFQGINFPADISSPAAAGYAYANGSPCRFGWIDKPDGNVEKFFGFEKAMRMREEYKHPFWKAAGEISRRVGGHGGMDSLALKAFLDAVRNRTQTPIDVYDIAAWMSVTALSEQSIAMGSAPVAFPDFTNGKWIARNDCIDSKWSLDEVVF